MLDAPARMSRIQSRQNTARTATSVPQCSATSKASPGSCHPNSQGTRMRCALEEIGKNSESPWTMPRTMAWTTDMKDVPYVPSCHDARYFSCSGVSLSIFTPIARSLRRAISRSMSAGTG